MTKKVNKADNSAKKQRGRPFPKGVSGNPSGKPKGTRHKATQLAETLLDGQTEELIKKCVDMAMGGDGAAMKLCLDRLISPRKDRPVSLELPQIKNMDDATNAMAIIANAVSDGSITPIEGQVLSSIIENYRKTIETTELEKRIGELELISKGQ
jgi:hypothetical protein